jgi:hypothetical protein
VADSKKLIAVIQPPKPVSQMTDDERHQFADEVVALTRERAEPKPTS